MSEPLAKLKYVYSKDLLRQAVALQVAVYEVIDNEVDNKVALDALQAISDTLHFHVKKYVKANRE